MCVDMIVCHALLNCVLGWLYACFMVCLIDWEVVRVRVVVCSFVNVCLFVYVFVHDCSYVYKSECIRGCCACMCHWLICALACV